MTRRHFIAALSALTAVPAALVGRNRAKADTISLEAPTDHLACPEPLYPNWTEEVLPDPPLTPSMVAELGIEDGTFVHTDASTNVWTYEGDNVFVGPNGERARLGYNKLTGGSWEPA